MSNVYDSMHSGSCCIFIDNELGPNWLIFSLSSCAVPAHDTGGQALLLLSQQIFPMKEVVNCDGRMIISHCQPM